MSLQNALGNLALDATVTTGNGSLATLAGAVTSAKVQINNAQVNGVTLTTGTGTAGTGTQRVAVASDSSIILAAGSATIGALTANQTVVDTPVTTGGLSKYHVVAGASTNAANVKASAGQVYAITAFNLNASPRFLKFHNTAGTPTAGSGVTDTYLIPGNTSGAGLVLNISHGIAFATGIGVSITGGIADADTTAISASEVVVQVYYK